MYLFDRNTVVRTVSMNMSEEEDCDDLPPITVNSSANNSKSKTKFCSTHNEQLQQAQKATKNNERIKDRWTGYFERLINEENDWSGALENKPVNEGLGMEGEGLWMKLEWLSNRSSPDGIPVEVWKLLQSTFAMPTAEELAEQRARERECERQLELLRQRARDDEQVAALRRSDSSGSEAEQALAAAVTALSVRAARTCAGADPPAAALWAALLPRLPPHAAEMRWGAPAAQLQRAVRALGAALAAERAAWPDDELLCAGALLSVAVLARESRSRRAAARALHALLDDRAAPAQVSLLTAALLAALPSARTRLQLSDALRSGGDGGADRAAFALTAAAMLELLRAPAQDVEDGEAVSVERVARAASAWRACDAETRYLCVQLAGRLLAATSGATDAMSGATDATIGATDATSGATDPTSGTTDATRATQEARSRLLAHLAPPPAGASDAQRPDRLKALVGASKLKLLFWAKNGVSKQPRAQRYTST